MTAITADTQTSAKRNFLEVWLITIGHSLTHWYPATFYILAPLIGAASGEVAMMPNVSNAQAAILSACVLRSPRRSSPSSTRRRASRRPRSPAG